MGQGSDRETGTRNKSQRMAVLDHDMKYAFARVMILPRWKCYLGSWRRVPLVPRPGRRWARPFVTAPGGRRDQGSGTVNVLSK